MTTPYLSVVIPIKDESPNILELHRQLTEALERWAALEAGGAATS